MTEASARPSPPDFDPQVRSALDEAKGRLAAGDIPSALAIYQRAWDDRVARGDHFHACVIAHMAGVVDPDLTRKHDWNVAALAEADAVADLIRGRGMYPSLYNNLGMSASLRGDRADAHRYFELARSHLAELEPGPYAEQVRAGIERNLARLGQGTPPSEQ